MATWVAGMTNPFVVKGTTTRSEREYTVKTSQAFLQGELIRINTSGQIQVAALDSDTTGPVHGIALANAATYLSGGDHAGETIPLALFNGDTVLGIQLMAAKDQDDVTIGASYLLAVASNKWTLTVTTTKGIATVESKPANDAWFDPDSASDNDTGVVNITFSQALLDARGAAA